MIGGGGGGGGGVDDDCCCGNFSDGKSNICRSSS